MADEETFLYEPTSFITFDSNVNPDSPRHFKPKRRRRYTANPILQRHPQTISDFRRFNVEQEQPRSISENKRSKTLIKRCENVGIRLKGVLHRTLSLDGLLNGSSNEGDESFDGEDKSPLNYSKPITSRFKVIEKRQIDLVQTNVDRDKPKLVRSKSDGGFCSPHSAFDREYSSSYHSYVTKTRSLDNGRASDFTSDLLYGDQYLYIEGKSTNSLDSLKSKSGSSANLSPQNSNVFSDFIGMESENDALSSDCSSIVTSENSFTGKSSFLNTNFDQDKNAEEKLFSRCVNRNRRPLSVHMSRESSDNEFSFPTASMGRDEEVFMIDIPDDVHYTSDKYLLDCIAENSLTNESKISADNIKRTEEVEEHIISEKAKIYEIDYMPAAKTDDSCIQKQKKMIIIKNENIVKDTKRKPRSGRTSLEAAVRKLSVSNNTKHRRTTITLPIAKGQTVLTSPTHIRIESVV